MEFFYLSKIYSDGKNSSAIIVKGEHARVWQDTFSFQ